MTHPNVNGNIRRPSSWDLELQPDGKLLMGGTCSTSSCWYELLVWFGC